jgi:hypothetical protein
VTRLTAIQRVKFSDADIAHAMAGEAEDAEDPTAQRKNTRNEEDESAALGKMKTRKQEHASYEDAEEVRFVLSHPRRTTSVAHTHTRVWNVQDEKREVEASDRKKSRAVDSSLSGMKARLQGKENDEERAPTKLAAPAKRAASASSSKPRKVLLGSDEVLKDYRFDHKRVSTDQLTCTTVASFTHELTLPVRYV